MTVKGEQLFEMRKPCGDCGFAQGFAREVSGQDVIRCGNCGRHCYNRPKAESGKPRRSVRRDNLDPARRKAILDRDSWRCIVCGAGSDQGHNLHIDHAICVVDGLNLGLTEGELNSDENLVTLCESCNLGKGRKPIELRLLVAVMKRRRWPA